MFQVKYDTIRTIGKIPLEDTRNLTGIICQKEAVNILKPFIGKRIITLTNPTISEKEIIKGNFSGGNLIEIKYYKKSSSPHTSNANLFFGGYGIGLDEVYDIMFVNSVKEEGVPLFEDLRIFKFEASAADEEERSHMLHVNPYLAYIVLRDEDNIKSSSQWMTSEKAKLGWNVYEYEDTHDDWSD
jgi:hypothetical protein